MKAKVTLVKIWATAACTLTLGTIFFLFAYIFYHGFSFVKNSMLRSIESIEVPQS